MNQYVKLNIIFFYYALFYSLPCKFTGTAPTFYIYYLISDFMNLSFTKIKWRLTKLHV